MLNDKSHKTILLKGLPFFGMKGAFITHNSDKLKKLLHFSDSPKNIKSLKPRVIRKSLIIFCGAIIIATLLGAGLFFYNIASSPYVNLHIMQNDNATKIYDNSGHLITRIGSSDRTYLPYNQIPKQFSNALTSIEDRHFFTNHGIDPIRIVEAGLSNLFGNSLQGGSTLTQQLVKLSVFSTSTADQNVKVKSQEAWIAMKLNHIYSKSKILELYANKVYMGNNTYGVGTAAKYYYGKPLNKLALPQIAMIAGMPQSPVAYNPYKHPTLATRRRNQVLQAMVSTKDISANQAEQAKHVSVKQGLVYSHPQNRAYLRKLRIVNDYLSAMEDELQNHHYKLHGGLKVFTNINMKDQYELYNLANHKNLAGFPNNRMQVGASLINPKNGNVLAIIGGRHQKNMFGLNRALQVSHSNGSTNKPLMDYGPAVQYLKYNPNTTVMDTPFVYKGTHIQLQDVDRVYKGPMTMYNALVQSRNVPAVRTLEHVGIPRSINFMNGLGLYPNPKQTTLQNGIGGYISPLQETAAYAAFADGGTFHRANLVDKIVKPDGSIHYIRYAPYQAMSPQSAYIITEMLEGVITNKLGSGHDAKISGMPEAGKTGTTQYPAGFKGYLPQYAAMDSWFAGYTPNLSMTVWTGYDKPLKPNNYITLNQTNIAQRFFKYAIEACSGKRKIHNWPAPRNLSAW